MNGKINYGEILQKAEQAFKFIQKNFYKEECTGMFLQIAELRTGARTVFGVEIGDIPLEKGDKYEQIAKKKIAMLYYLVKHRFIDSLQTQIIASKQLVDPTLNEWGGAIHSLGFFFSASGHTQKGDEALTIIAALEFSKQKNEQSFERALRNAHEVYRITPSDDEIGKLNEIIIAVVKEIYNIDLVDRFEFDE